MSLTDKDIKKLSEKLSKISSKDKKMIEDINNILKYMDLLNEIDTTGVKATVNVVKKDRTLRQDSINKKIDPKELLACSNQKVISDQIAISNIMK